MPNYLFSLLAKLWSRYRWQEGKKEKNILPAMQCCMFPCGSLQGPCHGQATELTWGVNTVIIPGIDGCLVQADAFLSCYGIFLCLL